VLQRDYPDQVCSIARTLEVIGERWTLLIVRDALVVGMSRFEEFQSSLGVASNVLTNRLKLLCDEGVLERVPDTERPGRPKYVLTEKGQELGLVLFALMKWGDRQFLTPHGPPGITFHACCGANVGPVWHSARSGAQPRRDELDLPLGPGAPSVRAAALRQ